MCEFLEIEKALRRNQREIVNNVSKLFELDKQLDRDKKKLLEIKDSPNYSEDLKDKIQERIDNAETEGEARFEVLLQKERVTNSSFQD